MTTINGTNMDDGVDEPSVPDGCGSAYAPPPQKNPDECAVCQSVLVPGEGPVCMGCLDVSGWKTCAICGQLHIPGPCKQSQVGMLTSEQLNATTTDTLAYWTWRKLCNQNFANVSGEIQVALDYAVAKELGPCPVVEGDAPCQNKTAQFRALLSELAEALPDGWFRRNHYYARIRALLDSR